jgi:glyoxylase-like metal-dependent hydrolase (beta-lactamase superfamily II)
MMHEQLSYPIAAPAGGGHVAVAPGVHWIRLPLPFRLDHINVWALDDGPGWALVDTGARTEGTLEAWEQLFAEAPTSGPLTRVLCTHMHPDHVGMAGWLTRKYDVRLWMSRLEYLSCRVLMGDTGREAPADALRFFHEAGWSENAIHSYRARFGNFGKMISALPDSYQRLEDGEQIVIGGNEWEVVMGNGHSPEHACFWCPALKLLISGDQVLPKISSNVSVQPTEPMANPLKDWLDSLEKVRRRVPDDVLVLPAHNEAFHGLHARIEKLKTGQDEAMSRLLDLLAQEKRVVDVFPALFKRPIQETDAGQLGLATGEGLACLNFFVHSGDVVREVRDGVAWYRRR